MDVEASKTQTQSTMQDAMVGKTPWHIKHVLLARTLLSLTGTPRALGDVTDCPNLFKNMHQSLGHSDMSLTVPRPGQRCPNFPMQSP